MDVPGWLKLVAAVIGVSTTLVGLTVYFTKLKLEGSGRTRSLEAELKEKRSTIAALEASVQALTQSVYLLRRGKEEAALVLQSLNAAVAEIRETLGATADSILIRNPFSDDHLVFLTVHGEAADRIRRLQVPMHGSVAGTVFRSGQARAVAPEVAAGEHFDAPDTKSGYQSQAILTVPLRVSGDVVGVVQFLNRRDGSAFTRGDIDRAVVLCEDLAPRVRALGSDAETLRLLGVVAAADEAEGSFAFLDITGSSSLFSMLRTGEAIGLLNEYFDRIGSLALRQGATIDKFLGDGMLLRFNVPKALPGYAAIAVATAVAIQREFRQIQDEWLRVGHPADRLRHRIGIATGPVLGGMVGHPQYLTYTVMGGPVNLAAHLCELARDVPGGVLICPTTRARARAIAGDAAAGSIERPGGAAFELPVPA